MYINYIYLKVRHALYHCRGVEVVASISFTTTPPSCALLLRFLLLLHFILFLFFVLIIFLILLPLSFPGQDLTMWVRLASNLLCCCSLGLLSVEL